MKPDDANSLMLASGSVPPPPRSQPHAQLRRLQVENQSLLHALDRIESLWVNLQKRANRELLPVDLLAHFLTEAEALFPTVLAAVYRVDAQTQEFISERCIPAGLQDDLEAEGHGQITQGNFALALRRSRPTVCPSLGIHQYHPRVRSIILAPLATLQGVYGMALIASERLEQDIASYELKLLSILAGQTALALESTQSEASLRQQKTVLEREVHQRTGELEQTTETVKRLNQELEAELKKALEQNEDLALADRIRERMLATASHELRTPLSAIIGSLSVLREEWGNRLPPEGQHLLEVCERNSTLLLSLISDLLDFSASGNVILRQQQVALAPLVQKTFEILTPLARGNDVKLLNTVHQDIKVYADAQRIQQVLVNLVGNAIKFSKKEGAYVLVGAAKEDDRITVGVTDNGIGIPPEQREHIFEPFVQGDSSTATSIKGTGLGLAICKSLIERHNGTIWVESTPGKGSRFFFSLPANP
jgi:signal transduction histidine kinase